jgi:hypothetical protein
MILPRVRMVMQRQNGATFVIGKLSKWVGFRPLENSPWRSDLSDFGSSLEDPAGLQERAHHFER